MIGGEQIVSNKSMVKAKFPLRVLSRLPETFSNNIAVREREYGLNLDENFMDEFEFDGDMNAPLGKSLFQGMVRNKSIHPTRR